MSKKLKFVLLLCHIGGGFTGLSYIISKFDFDLPAIKLALLSLFGLLFLFGIIGGYFLIWKEATGIKLSLVYHTLQVPVLYAHPSFVYAFHSGIALDFLLFIKKGSLFLVVKPVVGTLFFLRLDQAPFGLGINVFALVMVFILANRLAKKSLSPNREAEPGQNDTD